MIYNSNHASACTMNSRSHGIYPNHNVIIDFKEHKKIKEAAKVPSKQSPLIQYTKLETGQWLYKDDTNKIKIYMYNYIDFDTLKTKAETLIIDYHDKIVKEDADGYMILMLPKEFK